MTERIPVLKIHDLLLVTIQSELYDSVAIRLKEDIANLLERYNSKGVLLDISGLDVVDSFMGRMINEIAAVARLMDANTVIVGMRPAVAITLVELGLEMHGVHTALNVEKGFEVLKNLKINNVVTGDNDGKANENQD
ncbi:MAG: STAS domain-containing protein [Bacteroidota bacterium]